MIKIPRMRICSFIRLAKSSNETRTRYLLRIFLGCSLSFLLLWCFLAYYIYYNVEWHDPDFYHPSTNESLIDHQSGKAWKREIIVLLWTPWWSNYEPAKKLEKGSCSLLENGTTQQAGFKAGTVFDLPCRISFDRRYLNVSDALVFHSYDLQWTRLPKPHQRKDEQLWVYFQREPPMYTELNLRKFSNTFNWTMTYRRDSDVYHPYAHIISTQNPSPQDHRTSASLLQKKSSLVAWIVSRCDFQSKREAYVKELQKHIPVDIYGRCGTDCPNTNGDDDCYTHVRTTYKFYLSFENSLCSEYITEKFFNVLKFGTLVPIVYGGTGSDDYSAIAPKGSYIDVRSFKSPNDLAEYLLYLDKNAEEYLKYFEWKNMYLVASSELGWCNLCQRVFEHLQREAEGQPKRNSYGDLWSWWNSAGTYNDPIVGNEWMTLKGSTFHDKKEYPACIPPQEAFTWSDGGQGDSDLKRS